MAAKSGTLVREEMGKSRLLLSLALASLLLAGKKREKREENEGRHKRKKAEFWKIMESHADACLALVFLQHDNGASGRNPIPPRVFSGHPKR